MTRRRRVTRARRRLALGVLVVAAGTVVTACGVPVGSRPATIARNAVPFGLLQRSTPTTTSSASPTSLGTTTIYLVGPTSHLVPVNRDVPLPAGCVETSAGVPPDCFETSAGLTTVVQALVDGPTAAEAAADEQSELPNGTRVLAGTAIVDGIATVNFSASFGQLAGQAQLEAVAQVVFTVIGDIPGVTGVSFEIGGERASVPSPPAGALVNVATRTLYASLGP